MLAFAVSLGTSVILLLCTARRLAHADVDMTPVGAARRDITPQYPIRLSGYGSRREESTSVHQRIWTRALATGTDESGPALLIAIENGGLIPPVTESVAGRLAERGVARERFVAAYTHTHYSPCLTDAAPSLFGEDIPETQRTTISRYTGKVIDAIDEAHPGAAAIVTIGCGADANPDPCGEPHLSRKHGEEVEREVERLLSLRWEPISGEVSACMERIERGERVPETLTYPVQTWSFGEDLGVVFLTGEVVVDFSLRLKREYAG